MFFYVLTAVTQGIVGTAAGTLWYINWMDRSSIRLVTGHVGNVSDERCQC